MKRYKCIKNIFYVKIGDILTEEEGYKLYERNKDYQAYTGIRYNLNEYFIDILDIIEWREKQIDSILND